MMAKSVKKPPISGSAVLKGLFKRASVRRRMVTGHLGIIIERFVERLQTQGYTRTGIRHHIEAVEHFGRWLKQQQVALGHLSTLHVHRFLRDHLPRCRCPRPAPKNPRHCRAGVGRLVEFLRSQGRLKQPKVPTVAPTPRDQA